MKKRKNLLLLRKAGSYLRSLPQNSVSLTKPLSFVGTLWLDANKFLRRNSFDGRIRWWPPGNAHKNGVLLCKREQAWQSFVANELINEDTKTFHDKKLLLFELFFLLIHFPYFETMLEMRGLVQKLLQSRIAVVSVNEFKAGALSQ